MLYETAGRSLFAVTEQNQQLPGFMAYTKTSGHTDNQSTYFFLAFDLNAH
jgi:hypothetical protein